MKINDPHCWHDGSYPGDDPDPVCCLCADSPCRSGVMRFPEHAEHEAQARKHYLTADEAPF